MQQPIRTTAQVNEVASRADAAPGTVMRYFAGLPVRGPQRRRIERALAELEGERTPSTPPPAPTRRQSRRAA